MNAPRRAPWLLPALLALPAATQEAAGPWSIRLADRLPEARIGGPLAGGTPARALAELEDPALDVLLDERFDDFDPELEDWPPVRWARVVEDGDERFLLLEGASQDTSLGWVLPVRNDAFYRFERSVRVKGSPFCDVYVVESSLEPEQARVDLGRQFLSGRGVALRVHGVPLEVPGSDAPAEGAWQRAGVEFFPSPRTRSLAVLVRPRVGMDAGASVHATAFDDLLLLEVVPTRDERVRLLQGAHAAPHAAFPGIHKAGLLLPLPAPQQEPDAPALEHNYTWREALYAPPTTELAFPLALPPGARLRLATGLARETPPGAEARFVVEVQPADRAPAVRVLDQVRAARRDAWHWEELDLDLAAWAGEQVTLVLRTEARSGDPHPLWADPRVEVLDGEPDPLVILIAVDTLRADRLGAYGYDRDTTPALDRLAEDGVRFDQARSNCNWTCPSFASIFTGLVPSRHGVTSYGPATPLPDELVTLAEHFRAAGWATRSIAYKVPLFEGNYEQGFEQAFNVPRDVIRGEANLARALEWLDSHREGATFLFLHFNDPHQPFVQPYPFDRRFGPAPEERGRARSLGVPGAGDAQGREVFEDLYDGAVSYVDTCIGRFLERLRERGLYERATIAFVADHGEQLWEHGRFGHGGDDLFDEVVRVPLIVKPPAGCAEPGRVVAAEVSGFDVMPTLLDLAGLGVPAGLDARSLVPLLNGERRSLDRASVTETSLRGLALVDGGFKLVVEPGGAVEALYDLGADPLEEHDVLAERPEAARRLRGLAIEYVLTHRPGRFVLARAGVTPLRLELTSGAVRRLVGPDARRLPEGGDAATVVSVSPESWVLLEVEDPDPEDVLVGGAPVRGSESAYAVWTSGTLGELAGPGVWRVRGPDGLAPASAATAAEPEAVDPELLEALRRLGYVE